MRTSVTLRWIEQAEAAQVLGAASFERSAPGWRERAADRLAEWRDRVGACLALPQAIGCPAWQLQPVRVQRSQPPRPSDSQGYRARW